MKLFAKLLTVSLSIMSLAVLTGCAAGAATAGYALKAQTADSLTAPAEQRIVDRTKMEIMTEMYRQQQYAVPCQQTPCQQPAFN